MRLIAVLSAALCLAGPATAGGIVVHLNFAPGKLAVAAPAAVISAGGTSTVDVTVRDGRGSGAGWRLTTTAKGVTVGSIVAACTQGSTCTLPRAAAAPQGAVLLQAARGTGMGVIHLRMSLRGTPGTKVLIAVS